jgi:hypothetical protein
LVLIVSGLGKWRVSHFAVLNTAVSFTRIQISVVVLGCLITLGVVLCLHFLSYCNMLLLAFTAYVALIKDVVSVRPS